jgi:hypothetical protein
VNLYLPSSVRWVRDGARCSLEQSGDYPFADTMSIRVGTSRPTQFVVRLRIPEWAAGARIEVNGERWSGAVEPGRFAAISRAWHDGDRIDLELPRRLRLEPLDSRHSQVMALMSGPLVLFPIDSAGERAPPQRAELLLARQVAPRRWEAQVGSAPLTFLPFVAIDEQPYSTYLTLG